MEHKLSGLFQLVAQGDDANLQKLLLEAKEERNVATLAHGNTVLHEAAWNGFSRCVRVLCNVYPKELDENCNKEQLCWKKQQFINRVNFCGFSALHLAAQNGHNQTLRELLYSGCSTSIHNDYGDTPLHTACRYGHAGVVRILISAKCDVDSFNLNHDTPLHITSRLGRRKLTKLLLKADAMQFQNLNHETPLEIAERKNLREIVEIMTTYKEKLEKMKLRETHNSINSPDSGQHMSCSRQLGKNIRQHYRSPYGCHYYPDTRNFPAPNIESLPKEPLEKGEQYYLDLAGNICKGPIGNVKKCCCTTLRNKEKCGKVEASIRKEMTGDLKIKELAGKFVRNKACLTRPDRHRRENEKQKLDPFYPLMQIVGDDNKRVHTEQWVHMVNPQVDLNPEVQQKEGFETAIEFNRSESILLKNSNLMTNSKVKQTLSPLEDADENYTDISNGSEGESPNGSMSSGNNAMYDEHFMENFQSQQLELNTNREHSLTTPSISSNQNIEHEMERIAKSLLMGSLMISSNPDVIRGHIHHSAKRSTNKTKSAINKSTVLASGDLYVNTLFSDSKAVTIDDVSTISSESLNQVQSISCKNEGLGNEQTWNQTTRSRNPLPVDIAEFEKVPSEQLTDPIIASSFQNHFLLLDKQLKARKTFNRNYQQQLKVMAKCTGKTTMDSTYNKSRAPFVPSSSTLV